MRLRIALWSISLLLGVCSLPAQDATVNHGCSLRGDPSTKNAPIGHLNRNETVTLVSTRTRAGFYHVQTGDGTKGWVGIKYLTVEGEASTQPLPSPTPNAATGQAPNPSPSASRAIAKGAFNPVCALPFAGARNPAADDHCGIQGGSSAAAKQAESQAKNDFCEAASATAPQAVSYQDLLDLQSKSANIPKNIPDRKAVESLGEGKYVSYVAFVKDAHYSDVKAGEAVNCNIPGNDTNDIHIVLVQDSSPNVDECTSTTAEMSPHYRPPSWTPANIMKASAGHPVRVQGHLFYDGSHTPCTAHSRPNPKRASLWEVHPVYSFEVCDQTTIADCQSNTAKWTPLEKVFAAAPPQ